MLVSHLSPSFLTHIACQHNLCIIIFSLLRVFHTSVSLWFLTGVLATTSPQVSRTLLNSMADINNAVVWIVSTRSVISMSSSPCMNPLVTGLNVTFMFHSFFNSLARSSFTFFQFHSVLRLDSKVHSLQVLSFLLIIIKSRRLGEIW